MRCRKGAAARPLGAADARPARGRPLCAALRLEAFLRPTRTPVSLWWQLLRLEAHSEDVLLEVLEPSERAASNEKGAAADAATAAAAAATAAAAAASASDHPAAAAAHSAAVTPQPAAAASAVSPAAAAPLLATRAPRLLQLGVRLVPPSSQVKSSQVECRRRAKSRPSHLHPRMK